MKDILQCLGLYLSNEYITTEIDWPYLKAPDVNIVATNPSLQRRSDKLSEAAHVQIRLGVTQARKLLSVFQ